jgi:hypothetical protein
MCSTVYLAVLFAACTGLLILYKIGKGLTHQIADELAERRRAFAVA